MPNIEQYTNPIDRITPSNEGIEASVQAGRRIGTFFHQMGDDIKGFADQYQQHQDQNTLSDYTTQAATLDANYHTNLQPYLNSDDPENPGHQMGERKDAALEYTANFKTQNDALVEAATKNASPALRVRIEAHGAARMEEMQRTALAQQVDLDRATSARQVTSGANTVGAMAYSGADLDATIALGSSMADNYTARLMNSDYAAGTDAKAKIEDAYGYRAVKGAIDHAAEAGLMTHDGSETGGQASQAAFAQARSILEDPKYDRYIGEHKEELAGEIDAKERTARTAGIAAQNQARKAAEDQGIGALSDIRGASTDPQTFEPRPTAQTFNQIEAVRQKYKDIPEVVRQATALEDAYRESGQRQRDGVDIATDPRTYSAIMQNTAATPADVDTLYAQGRLSNHDHTVLRERAEDLGKLMEIPGVKEGMELLHRQETSLKPLLTKSNDLLGISDPGDGDQRYAAALGMDAARFTALSAQVGPVEALRKMTNAADPDYIQNTFNAYKPGGKYDMEGAAMARVHALAAKGKPGAPVVGTPQMGAYAQDYKDAGGKPTQLTPDQQAWIKSRRGGQ